MFVVRKIRLLVVLVVFLGMTPWGRGAEPLDLKYVGRDAIGAIVLRPSLLLTDPRYEDLPYEIIIAACEDAFGIDPRQVDQAIGTFSLEGLAQGSPNFGAILRFKQDVDLDGLLPRFGTVTEKSVDGKRYFVLSGTPQPPLCVSMPSKRYLLLGVEAHLVKMLLAEDVNTRLTQMLTKLEGSPPAAFALDFTTLRPLLLLGLQQMELPPEMAPFLQIPRLLRSIRMTMDLNPLALDLRLGTNAEADAAKLVEVLEKSKSSAVEITRQMLAESMAGDESRIAQATAQYTERRLKAFLEAIRVEQAGDEVQVALTGDFLTATAITGVATALLLPAIQSARGAARRVQAQIQLRQIGLALFNFESTRGKLPPRAIRDREGKPLLSWRVAILPYLDEVVLYEQFRLDEPWDSEHNLKLLDRMPSVYGNPGAASENRTVIQAIQHPKSIFSGEQGMPFAAIRDGMSRTLMLLEVNSDQAVPWTKPEDWEYDAQEPFRGLGGNRPDGTFLALFADGSSRSLSAAIPAAMLEALITKDGGELIDLDVAP